MKAVGARRGQHWGDRAVSEAKSKKKKHYSYIWKASNRDVTDHFRSDKSILILHIQQPVAPVD